MREEYPNKFKHPTEEELEILSKIESEGYYYKGSLPKRSKFNNFLNWVKCLLGKEKRRYGTFTSLNDIHPDTLIEMGKTIQKIEDGLLGCSMCGWFLDSRNGNYDKCGFCGFMFSKQ